MYTHSFGHQAGYLTQRNEATKYMYIKIKYKRSIIRSKTFSGVGHNGPIFTQIKLAHTTGHTHHRKDIDSINHNYTEQLIWHKLKDYLHQDKVS